MRSSSPTAAASRVPSATRCISTHAKVGPRAVVEDSVLFPGAVVQEGARVVRAILGEKAVVEAGVELGSVDVTKDTAVIGDEVVVGKGEE